MKYVLGVDPALTATGLSYWKITKSGIRLLDGAVITTKKETKRKNVRVSDDNVTRAKKMTIDFMEFLNKQELDMYDKVLVACEYPSGGARGAAPNRAMGIVTGLFVASFHLLGYNVETITAGEGKEALTGNNGATKIQVQKGAIRLFKRNPDMGLKRFSRIYKSLPKSKKEHFCDSIGVTIHMTKYSELYKIYRGTNG